MMLPVRDAHGELWQTGVEALRVEVRSRRKHQYGPCVACGRFGVAVAESLLQGRAVGISSAHVTLRWTFGHALAHRWITHAACLGMRWDRG